MWFTVVLLARLPSDVDVPSPKSSRAEAIAAAPVVVPCAAVNVTVDPAACVHEEAAAVSEPLHVNVTVP
jgi:hypothetical protein